MPDGPVRVELALRVGRRSWLNLWKPTIDSLEAILGRTRPDRDWHPRDGRITNLGLHLTSDASLMYDVEITLAAGPDAAE